MARDSTTRCLYQNLISCQIDNRRIRSAVMCIRGRVFLWEITVQIPSQQMHLRNLTCKIAVKIPSQKTHLGNLTCDFPEKYSSFFKFLNGSVA